MNEYDQFLKRRFYFATRTQKRRRIIVENQRKFVDGPKSFSGKQTADPGLLSPFKMDGWVIKIIGFELLTKGRGASNVVRNRIPDGGSYVAKSLAGKTFSEGAEKLEGVLRSGAIEEDWKVRC